VELLSEIEGNPALKELVDAELSSGDQTEVATKLNMTRDGVKKRKAKLRKVIKERDEQDPGVKGSSILRAASARTR
jgi:hypothetical protein